MTEQEFIAKWESRAAEYEQLGVSANAACLCRAILADLAQVWAATENRLLTLAEAADLTGYSADHLGRLVRQGKLPNAGSKHRPRLRHSNLPRRPQAPSIARISAGAYDPLADARSLASRRKGTR